MSIQQTPERVKYVVIETKHFSVINALMIMTGLLAGLFFADQDWQGFWWVLALMVFSIIYQFSVGGQPRKIKWWTEYEEGE